MNFDNFDNSHNSFLWLEYFIDYLCERWIPCQASTSVLSLHHRPVTVHCMYKRCVHLWNNFPCIKSLVIKVVVILVLFGGLKYCESMNLVFERFNSIKDFTFHPSVSAAADDGVTAQQKFLQCQQLPQSQQFEPASSLPDASYFQKVLQFRLIFSHQNILTLTILKSCRKTRKSYIDITNLKWNIDH